MNAYPFEAELAVEDVVGGREHDDVAIVVAQAQDPVGREDAAPRAGGREVVGAADQRRRGGRRRRVGDRRPTRPLGVWRQKRETSTVSHTLATLTLQVRPVVKSLIGGNWAYGIQDISFYILSEK